MAYRIDDDDAELLRLKRNNERVLDYLALFGAAKHVWDKGMIQITDHHDDEAAAQLANALNVPYARKFKQ